MPDKDESLSIIVHGVKKNDAPDILALRAAKNMFDADEGDTWGVGFEDGSLYSLRRNKKSISVWKQQT